MIELKKLFFESLKNYKNFRPYTDDEIDDEVEEYHSNEYTKGKLPKMWKDKDDGISDIKTASHEFLDDSELKSLQNSDVGDILSSDNKLETAVKLSKKYGKNYTKEQLSKELEMSMLVAEQRYQDALFFNPCKISIK